jgi:hypothetical protein
MTDKALESVNEQPFKNRAFEIKASRDIEHLLYLLNTGKLGVPHHTLEGNAFNPNHDLSSIEDSYVNTTPSIIIIDDFLDKSALQKLRDYCLEFPFWHSVYERGYYGAFRDKGFNPPVLGQLSLELMKSFPRIFNTPNKRRLNQAWAFQYESECPGIDIHADFAAVNCNFWITPTEANANSETGGMYLWNIGAPADWDFTRYNGESKQEIVDFLKESEAKSIYVPYKYNRAVLFDSNLFHRTADVNFKPGYANRRINVTMLFGTRENTGVEPKDALEVAKIKESVKKNGTSSSA